MQTKPKVIMHIEDNDDHAELVASTVSQIDQKYKIIRLVDAESGLDYLFGKLHPSKRLDYSYPDLILLDISLPGMNGLHFLKTIRNHEQTRSIPVIILTTSGDNKDIDLAYSYGANSYIIKPVDTVEFIIKLTELNMYWSLTSEVPEAVTIN